MTQSATASESVKKTIQHAAQFMDQNTGKAGISQTFGYFTRHPVAPLNQMRLKAILEVLNQRSHELGRPLRVLDLASGGGIITCAIAALGHRVLGMDLSPDEIHLAELFAKDGGFEGRFLQADLLQDPKWESNAQELLGGKPDAVTMAYALHHLPQVELFMKRLSAWADPGTLLVVNEENPHSPLFRLKHQVRTWIQKDTEVEWHRTYAGWKKLLEDHGFQLKDPLIGLDMLPGLGRILPKSCWSLVFTAQRV